MLYLIEVEVDIATFKTKVLSVKSIADIGTVGNQLAVEGQAYGGASHTIGFALSEDYSDLKRHSTVMGAGIPQIEDIPDDMEFTFHVTQRKNGPCGSSGCAEGFQSSSHAAVLNAINNAIGVRVYEIPAKPDKLKAAYQAKQAGQEIKPKPYALGRDFYADYDSYDKLEIK